MHYLLFFISKNLLLLHQGLNLIIRLKATVKMALLCSIPAWCIATVSNWTVSNQDYIAGVLVCIAIDHLVGSVYHAFKLRDFTFRKNVLGLLGKLGLCAASAVLFEVIHNTVKDVSFVYDYLKIITRLLIILYPAGSTFMNMSAITNGVFPPLGWIKKIAAFNENLDLEQFKKNGPDNT